MMLKGCATNVKDQKFKKKAAANNSYREITNRRAAEVPVYIESKLDKIFTRLDEMNCS